MPRSRLVGMDFDHHVRLNAFLFHVDALDRVDADARDAEGRAVDQADAGRCR